MNIEEPDHRLVALAKALAETLQSLDPKQRAPDGEDSEDYRFASLEQLAKALAALLQDDVLDESVRRSIARQHNATEQQLHSQILEQQRRLDALEEAHISSQTQVEPTPKPQQAAAQEAPPAEWKKVAVTLLRIATATFIATAVAGPPLATFKLFGIDDKVLDTAIGALGGAFAAESDINDSLWTDYDSSRTRSPRPKPTSFIDEAIKPTGRRSEARKAHEEERLRDEALRNEPFDEIEFRPPEAIEGLDEI